MSYSSREFLKLSKVLLRKINVFKNIFEFDGAPIDISYLYIIDIGATALDSFIYAPNCNLTISYLIYENSALYFIDRENIKSFSLANSTFKNFNIIRPLIIAWAYFSFPIKIYNCSFIDIHLAQTTSDNSSVFYFYFYS